MPAFLCASLIHTSARSTLVLFIWMFFRCFSLYFIRCVFPLALVIKIPPNICVLADVLVFVQLFLLVFRNDSFPFIIFTLFSMFLFFSLFWKCIFACMSMSAFCFIFIFLSVILPACLFASLLLFLNIYSWSFPSFLFLFVSLCVFVYSSLFLPIKIPSASLFLHANLFFPLCNYYSIPLCLWLSLSLFSFSHFPFHLLLYRIICLPSTFFLSFCLFLSVYLFIYLFSVN